MPRMLGNDMKKLSSLSSGEISALLLELRQKRLKLHKEGTKLRATIREANEKLEKNDRQIRDIEESIDNLEDL